MEGAHRKEFLVHFTTDRRAVGHIHQDVELLYVIEGGVCVQVFDKVFDLEEEDFLVINSNHRHSWTADARKPAVLCEIHFDYGMILEHLDNKRMFFHCNCVIESDSRYGYVHGLLSRILSECAVNEAGMTFSIKSMMYGLLDYLTKYFLVDDTAGILSKEDLRVEKMLLYLSANYQRQLSLREMADYLYMAPSSFSRFFKRAIGVNFVEYLNQMRLHFALEDLCYTSRSVTWIAENHGFTNVSAFCRVFKEVYGESPLSYRRNFGRKEVQQTSSSREIRRYLRKYVGREQAKAAGTGKTDTVRAECSVRQSAAWNNPWNRAMNLGMAYLLLDAEVRRQAVRAKSELGFELGRICGIFSERMMYREGHSRHICNYICFDRVLDFMVEAGIRPLISLDNKPDGVLKDVNNVLYERLEDSPFESMEELLSVFDDFLEHMIRRYGRREVSGWIFECWYYTVDRTFMGLNLDYVDAFEGICRKVREKLPSAKVGGWGVSAQETDGGQLFFRILEQWEKSEFHPDFVSLNLFPYMSPNWESEKSNPKRLLNTAEYYQRAVVNCRKKMDACGFSHVPICVSEWNTSLSDRNFFNETCGKAALMLQMMSALNDRIEYAGYMDLSDLSSVYCDTPDDLFGGKGLVSVFGARKPAYYALMFMNRMKPDLIYRDDCAMITADDCDSYTILCFNAKRLKYNYYRRQEDAVKAGETESIFEDEKNLEIAFCLEGVADGTYQVKECSVWPERGSVLDERERLGRRGSLDMEDRRYLREVSQPVHRTLMSGSTMVLRFSLNLTANGAG